MTIRNPFYKEHEVPVYAQNKIGNSPAMNMVVRLKLLKFKKYSEEELKKLCAEELNKNHMKFCEDEFLPIVLNAEQVCAFVNVCAKKLFTIYKLKGINVDVVFSPQNIINIYNNTVTKQNTKKETTVGTP